jgi:hypothetical protein
MPSSQRSSSSRSRKAGGYIAQTLRPVNNLLLVAPLLLFFHWGAATYGTDLVAPRAMHSLLRFFGATAVWLPAMLIAVVLIAQQIGHKDPCGWAPSGKALAGMLGEAIFWTCPLIAVSLVSGAAAHQAAVLDLSPAGQYWMQQMLQAVGAGVYEEFTFRVVFVSLLLLVLVDIAGLRKDVTAVAAVLVSAVLFSLAHFSGEAAFDRGRFLFLAVAGVYWGGLYVFRGFGIAAGCHVLWDVYVSLAAGSPV